VVTPRQQVGAILYEPDSAEMVAAVCAQLLELADDPVIVDNSTSDGAIEMVRDVCRRQGVELLGTGTNHGTAGGINWLIRIAGERGHDWLTYFDQDSRVADGYGTRLQELATVDADVAAVGSVFADHDDVPAEVGALSDSRYLIASGSSWRVAAVVEAGWCDQGMFLDLVDTELCMRLRVRGWRIIVDGGRVMQHHIGSDPVRIAGPVSASRHPAWRRRLMWRNSVVLARRYTRTLPLEVVRHLIVRVIETVGGSVRYRQPRLLWWALLGIGDGVRARVAPTTHPVPPETSA
jgi:rhamnosyltransferase